MSERDVSMEDNDIQHHDNINDTYLNENIHMTNGQDGNSYDIQHQINTSAFKRASGIGAISGFRTKKHNEDFGFLKKRVRVNNVDKSVLEYEL